MERERLQSRRRPTDRNRDRRRDLDRPPHADVDLRLPERGLTSWIGRGRAVAAGAMLALFLVSQIGRSPHTEILDGSSTPDSNANGSSDDRAATASEVNAPAPKALRKDPNAVSNQPPETSLERVERIGTALAESLPAEQRRQFKFQVVNQVGAHSGIDSEGAIFVTRPMSDTVKDDSQLAAMIALEMGNRLLSGTEVNLVTRLRGAISILVPSKFNPEALAKMAEWIAKTSSLASMQPRIDPAALQLQVEQILAEARSSSSFPTPK